MIIILIGVSQVGKSTVGKILAEKLNFPFLDHDFVIKDEFGSVEKFQSLYPNKIERYKKKADIAIDKCKQYKDLVFAMSPIYSCDEHIRIRTELNDANFFNLVASSKAIFERTEFYDEEMNVLPDSFEYKMENSEYIMKTIKYDNLANNEEFSFYRKIFTTKLNPDEVACKIISLL